MLYIKNLAKEVTLEDLHFVYGQLPSSYPHVFESRRGISFISKKFHILLSLFNCHEEVLTLLFLLHHENGDFSILMKDIIQLS